jgi:hypothetical protein
MPGRLQRRNHLQLPGGGNMSSQYEVFIECPTTGKLVSTEYVVDHAVFGIDEKPYGTFNCSSCHQSHIWSYEQAQIRKVNQ